MGLPDPFSLEKLKILAYEDIERKKKKGELEVMYNPSSYSLRYENVNLGAQGINTAGRPFKYAYSKSKELNLDLVFDGTGVGEFGLLVLFGAGPPTVSKRLDEFLKLCFHPEGEIHSPKHLRIHWGDGELQEFDCMLESVDVEFTSFERDGSPLAAKLSCHFTEDVDPVKQNQQLSKLSPDLTRSRVVKAGDSLPLLCHEIYGSSGHYLMVARFNGLDDFRVLVPGQELHFPPLPKTAQRSR